MPFPSKVHSRLAAYRAAFGMVLPEDDESSEDEYADATHFSLKGRAYAEGGSVPPEPDLGKKREAEMPAIDDPRYQLPVYRGENAKARAQAAKEEDEERSRSAEVAMVRRHASGGQVERPSFADAMVRRMRYRRPSIPR